MRRFPELHPLTLPDEARGVTVLAVDLAGEEERPPRFWGFLSEEERARAARFRFAPDRRRYVTVRGLLREVLGERLGMDPATVCFGVGPHGKPALADGRGPGFNVSHSGDRALLAFADDGRELGVDLESAARLGSARDLPGLAARALTPGDFIRWQALPEGERPGAFLRAWTRIEAYGKATGQGLGTLLGAVAVPFGELQVDGDLRAPLVAAKLPEIRGASRGVMAPRRSPSTWMMAGGWTLFDLPVGEGWAGALVVGSPP